MSNMPVDEGMCKTKTLQNVKRPQTQMKLDRVGYRIHYGRIDLCF
jgi:hypothetical protein